MKLSTVLSTCLQKYHEGGPVSRFFLKITCPAAEDQITKLVLPPKPGGGPLDMSQDMGGFPKPGKDELAMAQNWQIGWFWCRLFVIHPVRNHAESCHFWISIPAPCRLFKGGYHCAVCA